MHLSVVVFCVHCVPGIVFIVSWSSSRSSTKVIWSSAKTFRPGGEGLKCPTLGHIYRVL